MWTLSIINQLTSVVRMRRYKEERRRQLAFHVDIIHNQSVNLCCAHAQVKGGAEALGWPFMWFTNQSVNIYCTHAQV
jgi:hypothetical protein